MKRKKETREKQAKAIKKIVSLWIWSGKKGRKRNLRKQKSIFLFLFDLRIQLKVCFGQNLQIHMKIEHQEWLWLLVRSSVFASMLLAFDSSWIIQLFFNKLLTSSPFRFRAHRSYMSIKRTSQIIEIEKKHEFSFIFSISTLSDCPTLYYSYSIHWFFLCMYPIPSFYCILENISFSILSSFILV